MSFESYLPTEDVIRPQEQIKMIPMPAKEIMEDNKLFCDYVQGYFPKLPKNASKEEKDKNVILRRKQRELLRKEYEKMKKLGQELPSVHDVPPSQIASTSTAIQPPAPEIITTTTTEPTAIPEENPVENEVLNVQSEAVPDVPEPDFKVEDPGDIPLPPANEAELIEMGKPLIREAINKVADTANDTIERNLKSYEKLVKKELKKDVKATIPSNKERDLTKLHDAVMKWSLAMPLAKKKGFVIKINELMEGAPITDISTWDALKANQYIKENAIVYSQWAYVRIQLEEGISRTGCGFIEKVVNNSDKIKNTFGIESLKGMGEYYETFKNAFDTALDLSLIYSPTSVKKIPPMYLRLGGIACAAMNAVTFKKTLPTPPKAQ